jgi:hypothetical protein
LDTLKNTTSKLGKRKGWPRTKHSKSASMKIQTSFKAEDKFEESIQAIVKNDSKVSWKWQGCLIKDISSTYQSEYK